MFGFFVLLVALCALAAGAALIRGLVAFHADGQSLRTGDEHAIARFGEQQNRMMTQRVLFQALAVVMLVAISALFAAN